jgi:hypothetical protein
MDNVEYDGNRLINQIIGPVRVGLSALAELQARAPSQGKNLQNNLLHRRSTLLWRACDLVKSKRPTLFRPQVFEHDGRRRGDHVPDGEHRRLMHAARLRGANVDALTLILGGDSSLGELGDRTPATHGPNPLGVLVFRQRGG